MSCGAVSQRGSGGADLVAREVAVDAVPRALFQVSSVDDGRTHDVLLPARGLRADDSSM